MAMDSRGTGMTETLFFDTDCLSSFLWVGREDIILLRYHGRIVIPQFVYDEFCRPGVQHLCRKLDNMLSAKAVIRMEIMQGTAEAKLFRCLTKTPDQGRPAIGKGEASALVLAKAHGGIIASNNLRDIKAYATEFGIPILTTADIMVEAFTDYFITQEVGDAIWKDMLLKRRKLPAGSFSDYLKML